MTRDPRELGGAWRRFQTHRFDGPSPDLTGVVARYWSVAWDYEPPYRQLIVPYPEVHLTVRGDAHGAVITTVTGVASQHVVRVLEGRGWIVGVAFRAGCFRPFIDRPVSTITDTSIPAEEVFGPGVAAIGDDPVRPIPVSTVEDFLRRRLPTPDPRAEHVAGIVDRIAASPEISRVDVLAHETGIGVRHLQRLFAEYVGVGPKWVIRRYRLHEVTESLAAGGVVDWAGLAADLGYADQAHFVRDFTAMVGEPPTHYAQRY